MFVLFFGWSQSVSAAEPVRVLSYNIHHAEGVDRKLDVERIAAVISAAKPDLVALQELDSSTSRTNNVDQATELARLTNMHVVFGPNIQFGGGDYGNAVLSRYPIVRSKNHLLPNTNGGEQRGVLEVEVAIPGFNENVILFATHFDHRPDAAQRIDSAKFINAIAAKRPKKKLLLAGDLNARRDSEPLKELQQEWTITNDKELPTIPVKEPNIQIDFVLMRNGQGWLSTETTVLDEADASDHRGVFAVIDVEQK